jgi:hypothetical protein
MAFSVYAHNLPDCDVISGDNFKFKLHKDVLCQHEYFNGMFSSQMIEMETSVINMPEKASVLEPLFYFLYNGELMPSDEISIYQDLLVTASKYLIKDCVDEVSKQLLNSLSNENCIELLILFDATNVSTSYGKAFDHALK